MNDEPAIPIRVRQPTGNVLSVRISDKDLDWLQEQARLSNGANLSDVLRSVIQFARDEGSRSYDA